MPADTVVVRKRKEKNRKKKKVNTPPQDFWWAGQPFVLRQNSFVVADHKARKRNRTSKAKQGQSKEKLKTESTWQVRKSCYLEKVG